MKHRPRLCGLLATLALVVSYCPASAIDYPPVQFDLVGAVFDDGGTATGGFNFNMHLGNMPLPQFYNIQIMTSAGSALPGVSKFASSGLCYNDRKLFVCAPGDNFLMHVETGTPGEPGYDSLQIATYFAPNALVGQIGVLDPTASYEIACQQNGCFSRRIVAGAVRFGPQ